MPTDNQDDTFGRVVQTAFAAEEFKQRAEKAERERDEARADRQVIAEANRQYAEEALQAGADIEKAERQLALAQPVIEAARRACTGAKMCAFCVDDEDLAEANEETWVALLSLDAPIRAYDAAKGAK